MNYKKLQLDTVLFNSEDIITTSGDNNDDPFSGSMPPIVTPPEPQPQPVPTPGGQNGESEDLPV